MGPFICVEKALLVAHVSDDAVGVPEQFGRGFQRSFFCDVGESAEERDLGKE